MLGSMFAGTKTKRLAKRKFSRDVSLRLIVVWDQSSVKKGSSDRYFQGSVNEANKLVPEGIERPCCYKGSS